MRGPRERDSLQTVEVEQTRLHPPIRPTRLVHGRRGYHELLGSVGVIEFVRLAGLSPDDPAVLGKPLNQNCGAACVRDTEEGLDLVLAATGVVFNDLEDVPDQFKFVDVPLDLFSPRGQFRSLRDDLPHAIETGAIACYCEERATLLQRRDGRRHVSKFPLGAVYRSRDQFKVLKDQRTRSRILPVGNRPFQALHRRIVRLHHVVGAVAR